jgi:hypothetical protein
VRGISLSRLLEDVNFTPFPFFHPRVGTGKCQNPLPPPNRWSKYKKTNKNKKRKTENGTPERQTAIDRSMEGPRSLRIPDDPRDRERETGREKAPIRS